MYLIIGVGGDGGGVLQVVICTKIYLLVLCFIVRIHIMPVGRHMYK